MVVNSDNGVAQNFGQEENQRRLSGRRDTFKQDRSIGEKGLENDSNVLAICLRDNKLVLVLQYRLVRINFNVSKFWSRREKNSIQHMH